MTYQVQPGDFCVVHVRGMGGWLIRLGQFLNGDGFADYEHAFIVGEDGMIVEAEPRGARLVHMSIYSGRDIRVYRAPDESRVRIVSAAMVLVGTPYGFLTYLALALWRFRFLDRRLFLVARLVRGYVQSLRNMMCSQLVDEAYRRAGVQLFDDGRLPQDVTPADLWSLIKAQDATTVDGLPASAS